MTYLIATYLIIDGYLFNTPVNSFNECFPTNSDMSNSKATRQSKLFDIHDYPLQFSERQPIGINVIT